MNCADCGNPLRVVRYRFLDLNPLAVKHLLTCAMCAIARMKKGERCS